MGFLDSISFADRDDIQCLFDCTDEVGRVASAAEIIADFMCCQSSSRTLCCAGFERFDVSSSRYFSTEVACRLGNGYLADCFRLLRENLTNIRSRNIA